MKLIFKGKVAVVTGGSGGIGLDVSKKLAKLKIKVLILDINKPNISCLLYTSPSPRDLSTSRMPSSA